MGLSGSLYGGIGFYGANDLLERRPALAQLFQFVLRRRWQLTRDEPGSAMQRLVGGFEAAVIFEDTNQSRPTFLSLVEHSECGGN